MTTIGVVVACGAPVLVWRFRLSGAEGTPATRICGGGAKASTEPSHARSAFHDSVNSEPVRSPPQKTFCPGGPQAPPPGSVALVGPESRIAAPSRSRIEPVCAAKSPAERPLPFRGCQAKPQ